MPILSRFPLFLSPIILLPAALAACQGNREQPPQNATENQTIPVPAIPRPEPPLDRAALLRAVALAASSAAEGADLPDEVRSLDGRQFEVRIRFGCRGQAKDMERAWLGWSFDSEKRTLRLRAKPTISKDDALIAEIAGDEFESVEGFWIPRPWLLRATCPASAALKPSTADPDSDRAEDAEEAAAKVRLSNREAPTDESEQVRGEPLPMVPRIGIAQFFTKQDPRTHRRDSRPYAAVKTLPDASPLPSEGFNLVLSGRLRALPGRGPIQCVAKSADSPPECVVSAEFLRVWIERPNSKDVIAEWSSG